MAVCSRKRKEGGSSRLRVEEVMDACKSEFIIASGISGLLPLKWRAEVAAPTFAVSLVELVATVGGADGKVGCQLIRASFVALLLVLWLEAMAIRC